MRVLMINSVCGIRSTGRICTDLADVLTAEGHEVKIAYGRETVPEEFQKYAVRIGNDTGVKIHALKARLLDASGKGSRLATQRFIKWVKQYDPDIIHLHNIHGYYIHIGVLFDYLRTCGKRIIWTLHDCWAFTGHCSHFDYVGCNKWKSECSRCVQLKEYPKSMLFDNSKRNFKEKRALFSGISNLTLVTPSYWLAGVVSQSFLGQYPIKVIQNGIDLSVFKPTESDFREKNGLSDKKIILGVSSVWDRKKGLDDFIKLSKMIDEQYKIVLVGVSPGQKEMLPKDILAIERTNNKRELCEIYTAADVFVNPSVEETMGLTTAEALACGTPVIVYNKTAVGEVPNESCGIILTSATPESVFEALHNVSFNSSDCVLRAGAFEKTKKYFEYVELYRAPVS